jgi:hypothetical protein
MSDVYRDRLRAGLRRNSLICALVALVVLGVGLIVTSTANAAVAPASTSIPLPSNPSVPNTSPFPPSAPTNFTAVTHSTSVVLSWTASTPGCCAVVGYDITYNQAFDDILRRTTVGAVTTVTITEGIYPARQYRFSIQAKDTLGHYSTTTSITVVTPASDTGDQTAPTAPTNLSVGTVTDTTADLSWTGSTDYVGVVGYDVYLFDGFFISTRLATVPGTSYTAPLPSTATGQHHYYVRARDAAGNVSIASNMVSVIVRSGGPSLTSSPPPSLSCKVTYTNASVWQGGFVANITIANTGASQIAGWALTFTFGGDQQIRSGWGIVSSQSGQTVTLRNDTWNKNIPAGSSVSVGIQGTWTTSAAPPTAFTLNGMSCAVG